MEMIEFIGLEYVNSIGRIRVVAVEGDQFRVAILKSPKGWYEEHTLKEGYLINLEDLQTGWNPA